jgi:hypothetical protein
MRKKVIAVSLVHKRADDSTTARNLSDTTTSLFLLSPTHFKEVESVLVVIMATSFSEELPAKGQTYSQFRFSTVPSALDDDSDNDTPTSTERNTNIPVHTPKQPPKKQVKRMSMTSDLSSTPNGGDEWRMAYAAREEIPSPLSDTISYKPLDTDQGNRRKLSLTERFLVSFLSWLHSTNFLLTYVLEYAARKLNELSSTVHQKRNFSHHNIARKPFLYIPLIRRGFLQ